MKPTAKLHESGQSLWLDNISREMLDSGQLQRYIDEYSVTGLTSNPSIFDKAIASGAYDDEIRRKAAAEDPEELFFALAFEDLGRAADLFEPIHRRTSGVDGWVSLEVSPLLADDASRTVQAAADLHGRCRTLSAVDGAADFLVAHRDRGEGPAAAVEQGRRAADAI